MNARRLSPTVSASARGFTLLELLVVIVISGVLLGGLLAPLSTRLDLQQVRDEQDNLADIRDVLLGYVQAQGRLPCADTNGDGIEEAAPCGDLIGELPYATLGVAPLDRWGRRYRYAVTGVLTATALTGQPAPNAGVDLQDAGVFTVMERLGDKSTRNIATDAAAVIVSFGDNGSGGTDLDGNTLAAPVGADELENTDADTTFVTRIRTDGEATCNDAAAASSFCEFDDLVVLIPTPLLLGRLVQAGRLP